MYSHFDLQNAITFAHHCALQHQYEYFLQKYPFIFKNVNVVSQQASNHDYYVPSSIRNECKVFSVSFNEVGCRKVGCFPKTADLKDCTEKDPTAYIRIGGNFYLSCQPACHEISKSIDTEFKDGKCWQTNTEKKIFALFPEKIHDVEVYQPIHQGLDLKDGDLAINPDYCTAFGLSFENGDCIAPLGQEIGEFFLGSTVYKSIKKATIPKQLNTTQQPPPVPHDVLNATHWLEGGTSLSAAAAAPYNPTGAAMPYIPTETLSKVYLELLKDVGTDVGVDLSMDVVLQVMKKRIPNSIVRLSNLAIDKKIVQSAMMKAIVQSHTLTVARISKGLFSALSKVNLALSLFTIISSVVDAFDPFNFSYVLDKKTLSKVNQTLDYTFYKSNNRKVEITPEKIWNILENDMTLYTQKLEEKTDYYLQAVAMEDYETRYETQKKLNSEKLNSRKREYNWGKVFHVLFVTVLIVISLLFIKYIAYFLLIYLIFILFNQPSFY